LQISVTSNTYANYPFAPNLATLPYFCVSADKLLDKYVEIPHVPPLVFNLS